jgi:steroid delta-isomerase-like uncharacterized protein
MLNKITKNKLPGCLAGLLLLFSCQEGTGSIENQNQQIVKAYFNEAWNKGNVAALDHLLSTDYINHTPSTPNPPRGAKGLKPIVLAIRKGFPDLHYEIKELIVTKDRAVARVVMTGTNTGELFGMPPTGKKITVNQINIEKIVHGKIAEHWRVTDELSMMKQLGAL